MKMTYLTRMDVLGICSTKTVKFFCAGILLGFSCVSLSGCDLHRETYIGGKRLQVHQQDFVQDIEIEALNEQAVRDLAARYDRSGQGPMQLTVTYDPRSKNNTAMSASDAAAGFAYALRREGVKDLTANILPVKDSGEHARVLVTFDSYKASAPDDCPMMAGLDGGSIEARSEYPLGCSLENVFAKQIARPSDLAGKAQSENKTDGRRSANIVDVYRSGAPNESLGGESSTGGSE